MYYHQHTRRQRLINTRMHIRCDQLTEFPTFFFSYIWCRCLLLQSGGTRTCKEEVRLHRFFNIAALQHRITQRRQQTGANSAVDRPQTTPPRIRAFSSRCSPPSLSPRLCTQSKAYRFSCPASAKGRLTYDIDGQALEHRMIVLIKPLARPGITRATAT